jgi:hypothetical protein
MRWLPAVTLTVAVGLAGCGDSDLFDVTNPGRILDEDLNTNEGVNALVTGMSSDFSVSYDGLSFAIARLADEMVGSGSYFETGRLRRGLFDSEDSDGYWNGVQRARWVAEGGLERMKEIEGYTFDGNELTARAYLYAGLANRWFGENFCEVIFSAPYEGDDGSVQPRDAAFQRALPHLDAAIQHGSGDIGTAARGAMAQVHVGLGQWSDALVDAAMVPTDFVFNATYSTNSGREENEMYNATHRRAEMSAFGTVAGTYGAGDPRTPWTDCSLGNCPSENGADGETIHYRQDKYPDAGGDIPLVKGTEMRLLEAEYALMQNDIGTAISKINEVRTFHGQTAIDINDVTGVGSITGAANGSSNITSMSGWDILDRERHLTLWLEGRRLWDLHRWDHPYLDGGGVVYEATVARRASCLPISDQECQVNEKAAGKCFTM